MTEPSSVLSAEAIEAIEDIKEDFRVTRDRIYRIGIEILAIGVFIALFVPGITLWTLGQTVPGFGALVTQGMWLCVGGIAAQLITILWGWWNSWERLSARRVA